MKHLAAFVAGGAIPGLFIAQAALAGSYLSYFQPGDYPYDLAVEIEKRGCKMTETEIFKFIEGKGGLASDSQATIMNMNKAGELDLEADGRFKLSGFGKCR